MDLQLTGDVAPVSNDGVDREIEFVGNSLVCHAFYYAGDDFLLALAQRLVLAFFFIFFLRRMCQVGQLGGNDIQLIANGEMVVILFQQVVGSD